MGIHGVAMLIHKEFGWVFREQHESDYGIDAIVETAVAGQPEGRLLALQIKSGVSWFKEKRNEEGWILRGPKKNLSYWLKHQLPVLIVLFDPRTGRGYWVHVTPETTDFTPKGYSVLVPASHPLDSSTKDDIERIVKSWQYFPGEFGIDARLGDSDLVDDSFAAAISNSLRLHHSVNVEPLTNASLMYAVKVAAEASGKTVERNAGQGSAWDLMIDRTYWLLRTDRSGRISPDTVRIARLLDAHWIRDCASPAACAMAVRAFLPEFLADCDRAIVLRTSRLHERRIRYDLIEPPVAAMLNKLLALSQSDFSKVGVSSVYDVGIDDSDGSRICRFLIDPTTEKIGIWFSVAHCRLHGSWTIKIAAGQ